MMGAGSGMGEDIGGDPTRFLWLKLMGFFSDGIQGKGHKGSGWLAVLRISFWDAREETRSKNRGSFTVVHFGRARPSCLRERGYTKKEGKVTGCV